MLVPGWRYQQKLHIRHEKNLRHASIGGKNLPKTVQAGGILSGGVLKSAMQRLERGDVVTATQLARLTRYLSRFMCAGINSSHQSHTFVCSAIRHLAIFLKPE